MDYFHSFLIFAKFNLITRRRLNEQCYNLILRSGSLEIGNRERSCEVWIYAVHCLRRRTSPRPYWIPLAAVDQNYKAEQRFGTSVRDSSPRYPLLPPRPFSRSSRSVSIDLPNTFDILFFSTVRIPLPPPVSCSASFFARLSGHREFRETIGSTNSGGSGGAYRVSLSSPCTYAYTFAREKDGWARLAVFPRPSASWRIRRPRRKPVQVSRRSIASRQWIVQRSMLEKMENGLGIDFWKK